MKKVLLITTILSLFGVSTITAQTEDETLNKNISDISIAWVYAQKGYNDASNSNSALLLIKAAQMLNDVPLNVSSHVPLDAVTTVFSSKQLLEDAKKMAKGNKKILELIATEEAGKSEAPKKTEKSEVTKKSGKTEKTNNKLTAYNFKLVASSVKTFTFTYTNGTEAVVCIKSNAADAPLVIVKDSNGELVSIARNREHDTIKWMPTKSGQFQVIIKNNDNKDVCCVCITN